LRRNVFIFHNAALGDFVLTWPIAIAVGRVLAQSRIQYVTASGKGALAERWIGVESVDAETGWHTLHADDPKLPDQHARRLSAMQMGIVFSQTRDERFIGNLRKFADVPVIHVSPNPPEGTHVWAHHLQQLTDWPVLQSAAEQVQRLIDAQGVAATQPDPARKRVVLHPGSGAARKNWDIERFIEVARLIRQARCEPIFTIGEVEREQFSDRVIGDLKNEGEVVTPDNVLSLSETIASSEAYVGNDSGPTHLAAMLGKPTIALFGPTSDHTRWRPRGPGVQVMDFDSQATQVAERLMRIIRN
jgi:ADP-heptose:LPS heptosyltransferase